VRREDECRELRQAIIDLVNWCHANPLTTEDGAINPELHRRLASAAYLAERTPDGDA
jgi:hypothetical protein